MNDRKFSAVGDTEWLYNMAMGFEEDQWAYRQGFLSAQAYHDATDELHDEEDWQQQVFEFGNPE